MQKWAVIAALALAAVLVQCAKKEQAAVQAPFVENLADALQKAQAGQ